MLAPLIRVLGARFTFCPSLVNRMRLTLRILQEWFSRADNALRSKINILRNLYALSTLGKNDGSLFLQVR